MLIQGRGTRPWPCFSAPFNPRPRVGHDLTVVQKEGTSPFGRLCLRNRPKRLKKYGFRTLLGTLLPSCPILLAVLMRMLLPLAQRSVLPPISRPFMQMSMNRGTCVLGWATDPKDSKKHGLPWSCEAPSAMCMLSC